MIQETMKMKSRMKILKSSGKESKKDNRNFHIIGMIFEAMTFLRLINFVENIFKTETKLFWYMIIPKFLTILVISIHKM